MSQWDKINSEYIIIILFTLLIISGSPLLVNNMRIRKKIVSLFTV